MKLVLGYLIGLHVANQDLNNNHPLVEINDSVLVYQNSFDKLAVAGYKTFTNDHLKLRLGLTTGYFDQQKYKDKTYKVATATKDGVSLFIVPSYEKENWVLALLGDSINMGMVFKL